VLPGPTPAVAGGTERGDILIVEQIVDYLGKATVVVNLKLLALEILVVGMLLLGVAANLELCAAVELRYAKLEGRLADGRWLAPVRIRPV